MTASMRPGARLDSAALHRGELVGLHARIVRSCNPGIVGASGRVVRETKNMLVLSRTSRRRGAADAGGGGGLPGMRGPYRSYPKAGSVWRFGTAAAGGPDAPSGRAEIDGSLIARRPEDRLRARLPPAARPGRQSGGAGA